MILSTDDESPRPNDFFNNCLIMSIVNIIPDTRFTLEIRYTMERILALVPLKNDGFLDKLMFTLHFKFIGL